jgi:hypothetical protein
LDIAAESNLPCAFKNEKFEGISSINKRIIERCKINAYDKKKVQSSKGCAILIKD